MNDSIQKSGIKFYAARNEASAPMMAEAYAKQKNSIKNIIFSIAGDRPQLTL